MALGNANTSAQARGKNKPVVVKRRKEILQGRGYTSIVATVVLTLATNGAQACALAGSTAFDKEYYVDNITDGLPDIGAKIYTRARVNDTYLLKPGMYLFKVSGVNHAMTIDSNNVVLRRSVCR